MEEEKQGFFSSQRGKRFLKFITIAMVGWGLNELLILLASLVIDSITTRDPLFSIGKIDIEKILIESIVSISIVMVCTFIANKLWTFKSQEKDIQTETWLQFLQFVLIGLTGFAFYTGTVYLLATVLQANDTLATSIAFFIGAINNFVWNDLWTFNPKFMKKREEKIKKKQQNQE